MGLPDCSAAAVSASTLGRKAAHGSWTCRTSTSGLGADDAGIFEQAGQWCFALSAALCEYSDRWSSSSGKPAVRVACLAKWNGRPTAQAWSVCRAMLVAIDRMRPWSPPRTRTCRQPAGSGRSSPSCAARRRRLACAS